MTAEAKSVRYPIRLLRYWFAYHLLRIESARRAAPIDLVEIGVQKAQFLQFVRSAPVQPNVGRWTVVDAVIHTEKFRKVGIKKEDVLEANLESPDFEIVEEDELASNLSHGEQRNLEIGIALATLIELNNKYAVDGRDPVEVGQVQRIALGEAAIAFGRALRHHASLLQQHDLLAERLDSDTRWGLDLVDPYLWAA